MENTKPKGFTGKILRIDLGTREITTLSTYDYTDFVGGKGMVMKIFYDEVAPGAKAFDPENELIFMTGATTGLGIPCCSRSTMVFIAPNSMPEMFTWSGIGGFFGQALKFAGWDGFVLVGKCLERTYIVIDDDKVTFHSTDELDLWGTTVHDAENRIFDKYGHDFHSLVIGPAGENLVRNATITTSADNAAAKAGFGAVMGSKNLKAIAVRGTGDIVPGDIDLIMELRRTVNTPPMTPNPILHRNWFGAGDTVPGGWSLSYLACSPGCTFRCNCLSIDQKHPFEGGKRYNSVNKCIDLTTPCLEHDWPHAVSAYLRTEKNQHGTCLAFFDGFKMDETDPYYDLMNSTDYADQNHYWKFDLDRGNYVNNLCNEYGIDKWDVTVWYMTWISACKQEGLFDDIDFGMPVDVESEAFMQHVLEMVVFRNGPEVALEDGTKRPLGDVLAEGMARAIRDLGMEKYGQSIYHNHYNKEGQRLDIPVSLEAMWGHSMHWLGHGYQALSRGQWVQNMLEGMISSRDAQSNGHQNGKLEDWLKFKDDPCHSKLMAECTYLNDVYAEAKESLMGCDWGHHIIYKPDTEARSYSAATGIPTSEEEFYHMCERVKQLFRAMMMRYHGRTREIEVNQSYRIISFPDSDGVVVSWDDWNDAVDLYYNELGWDLKTGWPRRSTWEKYELGYIADDMEKLGMIPDESAEYVRAECPFDGHVLKADYVKQPGDPTPQARA
ncbi:MAG: hypothetical protein IKD70_05210 [Eggerthellaceae bacterium]|nr:hypothetical protein [Eggerthellaceae bacterium]